MRIFDTSFLQYSIQVKERRNYCILSGVAPIAYVNYWQNGHICRQYNVLSPKSLPLSLSTPIVGVRTMKYVETLIMTIVLDKKALPSYPKENETPFYFVI